MARWHGLWTTPALAPEINQELNIERLMAVSRHQPIAAAAHALMSLALAAGVRSPITPALVVTLAGFQIIAALQLGTWWRHRNLPRPIRVADKTISRIILWTVMLGLMWGALTAHLLAVSAERDCALLSIVIVGMAAGGIGMLNAIPAAATAFLVFSMVPPAAVGFMMGMRSDIIFGVFLLTCGLFMALSARRNYLAFLEYLEVRLRTVKLAEAADAANQAKTRFLANMGHELRTPLNAVIGFSEMISGEMKGPVQNPQYLDFADAITQSAKHLLEVINDILDLSSLETDSRRPADDVEVSVIQLFDHAVTAIQPLCDKAHVKLEPHIESDLPALRIDVHRMHQVLISLLCNAVAFSPPGATIRFEALATRPENDIAPRILFRVTDRGAGIPATEVGEILKPFTWARDGDRNQIPGTGLKLPLADQIVRAHGGTLDVTSLEGHGTTITMALPWERTVGYSSPETGGTTSAVAFGTTGQE